MRTHSVRLFVHQNGALFVGQPGQRIRLDLELGPKRSLGGELVAAGWNLNPGGGAHDGEQQKERE